VFGGGLGVIVPLGHFVSYSVVSLCSQICENGYDTLDFNIIQLLGYHPKFKRAKSRHCIYSEVKLGGIGKLALVSWMIKPSCCFIAVGVQFDGFPVH
jgi:hypothetical protein